MIQVSGWLAYTLTKPGKHRLASQGVTDPELLKLADEVLFTMVKPMPAKWIVERIRVLYGKDVSSIRLSMMISNNIPYLTKTKDSRGAWLYGVDMDKKDNPALCSYNAPPLHRGRPMLKRVERAEFFFTDDKMGEDV